MPMAWRNGDFSSLLESHRDNRRQNHPALQPLFAEHHHRPARSLPQQYHSHQPAESGGGEADEQLHLSRAADQPVHHSQLQLFERQLYQLDQGDIKLDWRPEDKDYFSARYSHGRQDNPGVNSFPLLYNSFNTSPFQNGVINWTRTISPKLVNELRVGVNNVLLDNGGADKASATWRQRRASPTPAPGCWLGAQ